MPHDAAKETSKRSTLGWHAQADRMAYWKERLGIVALAASLVWLGTNLVASDQQDFYSSRGPVASVHQIWDANCNACHVPFTPISSHSWGAPFLGHAQESSQRCQSCHEGTVHHGAQTPDLTCASCHREHRGRQASLVNLSDRDCTQCHKNLWDHQVFDAWGLSFEANISRFSKDAHPEFRSIKADPGKLKFNHELHLKAGMPIGEGGGALMTLGKLPEPFRKRYGDQQERKDDNAPVQLTCASCHQLDAGERNAGAYMLPIVYENHCQACHPLTIERKAFDDPKAGYLTIPHRLNPQEIHGLLTDYFTAQVARGQAGFFERKVTRPLPGKMPGLLEPAARTLIEQKVELTEKDLYLTKRLCAECHYFGDKTVAEAIQPARAPDLRVVPTHVPNVWFQHAKFNHTAHRAVTCNECHAGVDRSREHTDVLIPGRDLCIQCHAPTTKTGTPGARFNCTECHQYHNGEHAAQGIGAAARNPKKTREIEKFLAP